jgi:hypothetical protein
MATRRHRPIQGSQRAALEVLQSDNPRLQAWYAHSATLAHGRGGAMPQLQSAFRHVTPCYGYPFHNHNSAVRSVARFRATKLFERADMATVAQRLAQQRLRAERIQQVEHNWAFTVLCSLQPGARRSASRRRRLRQRPLTRTGAPSPTRSAMWRRAANRSGGYVVAARCRRGALPCARFHAGAVCGLSAGVCLHSRPGDQSRREAEIAALEARLEEANNAIGAGYVEAAGGRAPPAMWCAERRAERLCVCVDAPEVHRDQQAWADDKQRVRQRPCPRPRRSARAHRRAFPRAQELEEAARSSEHRFLVAPARCAAPRSPRR